VGFQQPLIKKAAKENMAMKIIAKMFSGVNLGVLVFN
jgi:hypothetical protein